jgi:hypothetical protein
MSHAYGEVVAPAEPKQPPRDVLERNLADVRERCEQISFILEHGNLAELSFQAQELRGELAHEIEQLEKQADGLQKLLEESLGGRGFDDEFDKKKPAEGSQEEEDAETADEEAAEQVKKQLDDMQAELASLGADLGKALIEAPQTAWNTRVAKVARDQEADHFGTRVSSTPAASKR